MSSNRLPIGSKWALESLGYRAPSGNLMKQARMNLVTSDVCGIVGSGLCYLFANPGLIKLLSNSPHAFLSAIGVPASFVDRIAAAYLTATWDLDGKAPGARGTAVEVMIEGKTITVAEGDAYTQLISPIVAADFLELTKDREPFEFVEAAIKKVNGYELAKGKRAFAMTIGLFVFNLWGMILTAGLRSGEYADLDSKYVSYSTPLGAIPPSLISL